MMALSAMAGNLQTGSHPVKPASMVAAKLAPTFKKTAFKHPSVKVSTRTKSVHVRHAIPAADLPTSRKAASVVKPAAAKKLIPPMVKAPPRPRIVPAVKAVVACPVKKPLPARAGVPKPTLVPVIRHDPGEFIDISYPPLPRAKKPVLAAARPPRR